MHEDQECGLGNPTVSKSGLRDDREYGHSDLSSRKRVILAAANMYCSICDAEPCYLLATAAITVVQEQLTESDGDNLIGAVRYEQSLERLHQCLRRHHETATEAWQLEKHFRVSEDALREIERQRRKTEQLQDLQTDARDPPSLN
jgi:hypothetical protein